MFISKKICYIVGAVDTGDMKIQKKDGDLVIAADGGYDNLSKLSVQADIVLGDFDSLKVPPVYTNLTKSITFPAEKDETDMLIAVKEGFTRGYKNFLLLGGLGGDFFDHSIANLQTLNYIAEHGGAGYLLTEKLAITSIKNAILPCPHEFRGRFSVFSAVTKSRDVSIKNAKYPLDKVVLDYAFPLGVSNFAPSDNVEIEVGDGVLWVIFLDYGMVTALRAPKPYQK